MFVFEIRKRTSRKKSIPPTRIRINLLNVSKNESYKTMRNVNLVYLLWTCNKVNFHRNFHHVKKSIQSLVRQGASLLILITAWVRGLFFWVAAPRMFEWVLNTPLILLRLLSLSTICEEVYPDTSQVFAMRLREYLA